MKVLYKHDYGHEAYGEVREVEEGVYQCYLTPLYGGEYYYDCTFTDLKQAMDYLKSIT